MGKLTHSIAVNSRRTQSSMVRSGLVDQAYQECQSIDVAKGFNGIIEVWCLETGNQNLMLMLMSGETYQGCSVVGVAMMAKGCPTQAN